MDLDAILKILNLINLALPTAARFALMFSDEDGTLTELTDAEKKQDALDTLDKAEAQTDLNIARARAREAFLAGSKQ